LLHKINLVPPTLSLRLAPAQTIIVCLKDRMDRNPKPDGWSMKIRGKMRPYSPFLLLSRIAWNRWHTSFISPVLLNPARLASMTTVRQIELLQTP
jgi:hypothetical protein